MDFGLTRVVSAVKVGLAGVLTLLLESISTGKRQRSSPTITLESESSP